MSLCTFQQNIPPPLLHCALLYIVHPYFNAEQAHYVLFGIVLLVQLFYFTTSLVAFVKINKSYTDFSLGLTQRHGSSQSMGYDPLFFFVFKSKRQYQFNHVGLSNILLLQRLVTEKATGQKWAPIHTKNKDLLTANNTFTMPTEGATRSHGSWLLLLSG